MSRIAISAGSPRSRVLPNFSLALQFAVRSTSLPSRYQFRKWVAAALYCDADIALRLVGAAEGRRLNRQYRGQDHATNVLTFAYPDTRPLSGDIVLCVPVIASEARLQDKPLQAHYAHLVIHGTLHLQGYDHTNKRDANRMEALESAIVTGLRYADPYQTQVNGER